MKVDSSGAVILTASGDIHIEAASTLSANGPAGGRIEIESAGGDTWVSGAIAARGESARGGDLQVLGERVALLDGAALDASGATGGGTVLVGGDFQGANPTVRNASATYVASTATVSADALERGDGGKVIVWGDDTARVYGTLTARGGSASGDGGLVETSGHYLDTQGIRVNASAANGTGGEWLLDPFFNVDITAAVSANGSFSGGNPDIWTPSADASNVLNSDLEAILDTGTSATITSVTGGTGTGRITVSVNITKSGGGDATLDLKSHEDVVIDPGVQISSSAGKLNLILNGDQDASGGGQVNIGSGAGIMTNGGDLTIGGGADPTTTPAIGSSAGLSSNDGVSIDGATISTAGGDVSIRGDGFNGVSSNAEGVLLLGGTTIDAGGGNVAIIGTGGGAGTSGGNQGVFVSSADSVSTSGAGTITISGTGGDGTSGSHDGVEFDGSAMSGSGTISITGTGGPGVGSGHRGVRMNGANIGTAAGDINITGTGTGISSGNEGVTAFSSTVISSTAADNIDISGVGGPQTDGVRLTGGTVSTTGTGTVSLNGTGGGVGSSQVNGVRLTGTAVSAVDGDISFTGTGGGGGGSSQNRGVDLGATVTATGAGRITITGTGGAGTITQDGVRIISGSVTSLSGDITITGTASSGTTSTGVVVSAPVESTGSPTSSSPATAKPASSRPRAEHSAGRR